MRKGKPFVVGAAPPSVACMKIQLEKTAGRNIVRAYEPGRITVNQEVYTTSLVLMPDQVLPDWPPEAFADLAPVHFEGFTAFAPEIVLLGTGARLRFPAPQLTRSLTVAGIGLEVMDTGAACRTYNILMAEDRRVLAALLMIEGEAR